LSEDWEETGMMPLPQILIMAYYILKTGRLTKNLAMLFESPKKSKIVKPCKAFAGFGLCGRIEEAAA